MLLGKKIAFKRKYWIDVHWEFILHEIEEFTYLNSGTNFGYLPVWRLIMQFMQFKILIQIFQISTDSIKC